MHPLDIMREVERMAETDLWKGFAVQDIPVAIYDGDNTWLFQHTDPGDGFAAMTDEPNVYLYRGLHEAVRANSTAEINGLTTATVMLEGIESHDLSITASVIIHEMFHVYQALNHPDWNSDIAALFMYPFDQAEQLRLRRLETEAVHRALLAADPSGSAAWCREALKIRTKRYECLPSSAITFERDTELYEGLAHYIELKSRGEKRVLLSETEFAPDEIRRRCYPIGCALAFLLDRYHPDWQEGLTASKRYLDEMLATAMAIAQFPHMEDVGFSPGEQLRSLEKAKEDIAKWLYERETLKQEFHNRPGWRLILDMKSPLFTRGMDPSNVHKLSHAEILHTRFVQLGNETDRIEMINGTAITISAGNHPLFDGIKSAVFAFEHEPELTRSDGIVVIEAEGFKGILGQTNLQQLALKRL
jgi:hypothetical protein